MKRLKHRHDTYEPPPSSYLNRAALIAEWRKQLFQWMCLGSLHANQIAVIAYYTTALGAVGILRLPTHTFYLHRLATKVETQNSCPFEPCLSACCRLEDLSVKPDQASRHGSNKIKLVLGREFGDPNLEYCKNVPTFDKLKAERSSMDIPILLPSKVWAEEFEGHEVPEVDAATKVRYECEAWCQHPVVLGASNPSRVVPGALYVDGVQYSETDSLEGIFLRDLRTNVSHLLCLLRSFLLEPAIE